MVQALPDADPSEGHVVLDVADGAPYGFLRGAAGIMAAELARLPATGITPVIGGDAHVGNFGFYASPEQRLVLDINDFDEAHPGSWEWDLRRLSASVWVSGRENGADEDACEEAVAACCAAYRDELWELFEQPLLDRSFRRLDRKQFHDLAQTKSLRQQIKKASTRARSRTSDRALPRFTADRGADRRIVEEPPLITRLDDEQQERLAEGLDRYLLTLAPHWRRVVGGYTLIDVAHKVVGVGSVGLRAYVALLEGSSPDDVIFLQLKQARRSVVAPFVHGESPRHDHQGERVVEYQPALQTVRGPVRAKGHARTSGASMIVGYIGRSDKVDAALCRFARDYADQTERDHGALVKAAAAGRIDAEYGI